MSLQVAILKVLAGRSDGRATLDDMRRDLCILASSGHEWNDRMKRLAARAPGLDIFGQKFVRRDSDGWEITEGGREILEMIETSTDVIRMPAATPLPTKTWYPILSDRPRSKITVIGLKIRRRRHRARGEAGPLVRLG